MEYLTLPAGTIVKVNGLPFELCKDTVVYGHKVNLAAGLAPIDQLQHCGACGNVSDGTPVIPECWLIEDPTDDYKAVTFVDPATGEGAYDGFTVTPLVRGEVE